MDSRPKAGSESPRDMLWLLMAGFAVILLAYAVLSVVGEFAYRGMKRLLGRLV